MKIGGNHVGEKGGPRPQNNTSSRTTKSSSVQDKPVNSETCLAEVIAKKDATLQVRSDNIPNRFEG